MEVLVVIFIMSLMSSAVAVSYNAGQKIYRLAQAHKLLSLDLRRVQNLAIAGKAFGAVMPKGYGLYTEGGNQYLLFYNTVDQYAYRPAGDPNPSIVIETVALPANVTLAPTESPWKASPLGPTVAIATSSATAIPV